MKFLVPALFALCSAQISFGQVRDRGCGTKAPPAVWDVLFNKMVAEQEATHQKIKADFVIPVIVHIIHGGQPIGTYPNITQTQVNSQIPVLNYDFSGAGFNVGNIPPAFASKVANTGIIFCLAQQDPSGNLLPEPGIIRINYHTLSNASNPGNCTTSNSLISLFDNVIKPQTIWDPTRYYNIWVSDVGLNASILGYAAFPAFSGLNGLSGVGGATDDGVWIYARSFGSVGLINAPYDRGRTATHETGHWLGLRHIWGDGNCADDFCQDTPAQQTSNFGCPSYPKVTCNNGPDGDMFMNFMDYSDDPCLSMFTPNQMARMIMALNNSPQRKLLTASASTLCSQSPGPPDAIFAMGDDYCANLAVQPYNLSTGIPGPAFSWSCNPSSGVVFSPNSTVNNPSISFPGTGVYSITMMASNTEGYETYSKIITIKNCPVGIDEETGLLKALKLFPNPSKGTVRLSFPVPLKNVPVFIYDQLGRKVKDLVISEANTEIISTSDQLAPGLYHVVLVQDGKEISARFSIEQ